MLASSLDCICSSSISRKVPQPHPMRHLGLNNSIKRGINQSESLLPTCIFPAFGRRAGGPGVRRAKPPRARHSQRRAPLTQDASLRQGGRIRDEVAARAPLAGEREER